MTEEFSVEIDPYRLDEEWVRQPKLYHKYASLAADARQRMDEAKNGLEVIKSELYREIVSNPEAHGLAKTTEASIANAITSAKEYQDAVQEHIDAKHALAIIEAGVQALDHRKKALEKLVELHVADYYSKPKVRKGEAAEYIKESTRRPVSGLSRKRQSK